MLGCRGQHVLQCLTQVIFPIVNMQETGGHRNGLCLCARITSSCCHGPWMFLRVFTASQQNTEVSILGGQKVTSILLCSPAGKLIERRVLRLKQLQDKPRLLSSPKASWLIWLDSSSQVASLLHEDTLIHSVKWL